jgi:hypothetical protein
MILFSFSSLSCSALLVVSELRISSFYIMSNYKAIGEIFKSRKYEKMMIKLSQNSNEPFGISVVLSSAASVDPVRPSSSHYLVWKQIPQLAFGFS